MHFIYFSFVVILKYNASYLWRLYSSILVERWFNYECNKSLSSFIGKKTPATPFRGNSKISTSAVLHHIMKDCIRFLHLCIYLFTIGPTYPMWVTSRLCRRADRGHERVSRLELLSVRAAGTLVLAC